VNDVKNCAILYNFMNCKNVTDNAKWQETKGFIEKCGQKNPAILASLFTDTPEVSDNQPPPQQQQPPQQR